MLKKFKSIQEQWGGSSEVIDHWLNMRQSLIVEFCALAVSQLCGTKGVVVELPSPKRLSHFCELLVDYISAGHFKIYDMVMDKWQSTGFKATDEINHTYSRIVNTTDPLLNFTDKYADIDADDELDTLDRDLSVIGEILEERFTVEDQLIQLIADSLSIPPGA